jgi:succinate dehydrogenase / fumarate reductase, cytochrome b subunit
LSWLTGFLKSSVGRKFVMAITGLFLCFFLVIHLSGNLLLYIPGGQVYVDYAEKLHSNEEFLILAEIFLFAAFALHIVLAFSTTKDNLNARKKSYRVVESKRKDRAWPIAFAPDYMMMITGLIGFAFLVVHIADFKLEWMWTDALAGKSSAQKVGIILGDSVRSVIYLAGSLALGYHVSHGLQSACQTIGFNHPKYNRGLKIISIAFGIIVAIGFSSFPIIAQLVPGMLDFPDIVDVEVSRH